MKTMWLPAVLFALFLVSCGGGGGSATASSSYTPIQTPPFSRTFSGSTAQVLNSFDLPAGLYKITVNTTGYFQLFYEGNSSSIFNLSPYESNGAETIFNSHGGSYIFKTANISNPWSLKFENIDFSNPAPIMEINSVSSSTPKVLGPFKIPVATYKITMNTDGYFQLFPYDPVTGREGSSIFNEISGNWGASTTYTPPYDIMLFRTDNISALWTMAFAAM